MKISSKNKKNDPNEKQQKTENKEQNPVTMNGDSNMSKPVRSLK
ncbi:hypothetical protein [Clostridium bowmanii]|nr:hypothetical protein [Clostridium bowmanii]